MNLQIFLIQKIDIDSVSKRWNGSFKGKSLQIVVYVYYINILLPDVSSKKKPGDITIVK